jgi:hypothetical protein
MTHALPARPADRSESDLFTDQHLMGEHAVNTAGRTGHYQGEFTGSHRDSIPLDSDCDLVIENLSEFAATGIASGCQASIAAYSDGMYSAIA